MSEVWDSLKISCLFSCVAVLPSYAECVNGGTAVQEERDTGDMSPSTFTPMYPFVNDYQFPSAPSQHAAAAQALPVSSSKPRIPSYTLN